MEVSKLPAPDFQIREAMAIQFANSRLSCPVSSIIVHRICSSGYQYGNSCLPNSGEGLRAHRNRSVAAAWKYDDASVITDASALLYCNVACCVHVGNDGKDPLVKVILYYSNAIISKYQLEDKHVLNCSGLQPACEFLIPLF